MNTSMLPLLPYKNLQMQLIIVACCLLGTTFSASLLGIDFSGPKKVMNTGIEEISQVLKPNIQQQMNSPLDFYSQSSGIKAEEKENTTPSGIVEDFKNKTEQPPEINELTQNSDNRIPIKNNPSESLEKPEILNPNETGHTTHNTSELSTDSLSAECSESGSDYTTETSEHETTTTSCVSSLNRVGGIPPNVIASILG